MISPCSAPPDCWVHDRRCASPLEWMNCYGRSSMSWRTNSLAQKRRSSVAGWSDGEHFLDTLIMSALGRNIWPIIRWWRLRSDTYLPVDPATPATRLLLNHRHRRSALSRKGLFRPLPSSYLRCGDWHSFCPTGSRRLLLWKEGIVGCVETGGHANARP